MVLNLSAPDKNMFIVFIGPLVSSSSLNGLTPLLIETSTMLQVKSLILLDITSQAVMVKGYHMLSLLHTNA